MKMRIYLPLISNTIYKHGLNIIYKYKLAIVYRMTYLDYHKQIKESKNVA